MKKIKVSKPKTYALFDTQDNVWIGNEEGVITYTAKELSEKTGKPIPEKQMPVVTQMFAQIVETQLGFEPGRIRPKVYDFEATKKRDEVTVQMTAEEALRHIESGGL